MMLACLEYSIKGLRSHPGAPQIHCGGYWHRTGLSCCFFHRGDRSAFCRARIYSHTAFLLRSLAFSADSICLPYKAGFEANLNADVARP
eukprot:3707365-Pleurochrysis_carterae.AAC.4